MFAHNPNAYYSPTKNEIVFPAGILQKPLFSLDYTDAENFGGIGSIIAHEMTHGFDARGRLFDENGAMTNWWTESDIKNFVAKTELIEQEFSSFEVYGTHINGELTLNENIADIGGLKLVFDAVNQKLKKRDPKNFTNQTIYAAPDRNSEDQRLRFFPAELIFMSYARVWRGNTTKEDLLRWIATDPHTPHHYRVNGNLRNVPEFFKTYHLNDTCRMMPKNGMATIW